MEGILSLSLSLSLSRCLSSFFFFSHQSVWRRQAEDATPLPEQLIEKIMPWLRLRINSHLSWLWMNWGAQDLQEIKKDFFKELLVKSVSFEKDYIRIFTSVGLCCYWKGIYVTWVLGGGLSLVLKAFGAVIPLMSWEWTIRKARKYQQASKGKIFLPQKEWAQLLARSADCNIDRDRPPNTHEAPQIPHIIA